MVDFAEGFPDVDILAALGDSITHITAAGVSTVTKAIVDLDLQANEYVTERSHQIELLSSAFASKVKRGDSIVFKEVTYKLDSLLSRDVGYETWSLINA